METTIFCVGTLNVRGTHGLGVKVNLTRKLPAGLIHSFPLNVDKREFFQMNKNKKSLRDFIETTIYQLMMFEAYWQEHSADGELDAFSVEKWNRELENYIEEYKRKDSK